MKRKFTLLIAALALLTMIVQPGRAWGQTKSEVTDVLNRALTGITGTNYSSWSGKTSNSDAVWAGQSAGGKEAIQLRSNYNNSGIITTASGGTVTKVVVTWQSDTQSGRTLNVYGKSSAYSSPADLYNANNQGTLIGTIVCGTSTELTITDSYDYIGMRSASGAMYLSEVDVIWSTGGGTTPSITASNVDIAYDATNGSIAYEINNPVSGGELSAALTTGDWLTVGTVGETVPFTCSANPASAERSATVTLTYTYNTTETVSKNVTVTQAAAPVIYTTIPAMFDAATSTATNVNVTFDSWVISAVKNSNAYLTDNQGNGLIIYASNHGFQVNDVLTGTASCKLQLYRGSAELTELTSTTEGLTVTHNGTVTEQSIAINALGGVNTGALLTYSSLTYNGTALVDDDDNEITPYNTLYSYTFVNGKTYNVKGIYLQYNQTKELLPRSADDIEEVIVVTPVISAENVEITYDATSGTITYEIENYVAGNMTASTEATWISDFTYQQVDEIGEVGFTTTENDGAARQATVTLTYTYNTNQTVTKNVTISQAAAPVPSITVTPATVNAPYTGETSTLALTYQDITITGTDDFGIQYYDANNEPLSSDPDWLLVVVEAGQTSGYVVSYTIDENDSDARTAYFKVFAMNDEEFVYSNLVTINQAAPVTPPTPGTWVLTNLADLTANDIFVIVGTDSDEDTYALPNNGTSAAPTVATITIVNGALSTEPAAELQWNISGNATDGYTFYPNGSTNTWLYCNTTAASGSNNNIRVGTGDRKVFELDSNGYLVTNDDNVDRYLSIYVNSGTAQDWRGYINSNSAPTIAFYKKVTGPVPVEPTITVAPAEITNVPAAGDVPEHTVTLANITITSTDDFEFVYCDSEGNILGNQDPKPNWIELADAEYSLVSNNIYNMVYTVAANEETTPRTGYFKIGVEQTSGTVYSNLVTITQEAYVAPVASITVDPVTVNATAAETEGTIIVTYENITTVVAEVYFCDAQGAATTYEWVDAEIDDDDNVYYTIDANTGEARTAYLKVHAFDDDANDVYSDLVTINQAAYVVDYATLPFAYDGNGLGTLPNGLTQEGLTDKYNNSPKMKFDGTGDWLLLHINERPGTLTFNIKGNSFGGDSEFKVQTSADGTNYTDLATYTDLTSTVQSEEFDNLDGNIRYIKWIYTNKDAGNVALGNIALAQYVEPQPSITINPGPYDLNSEGGDAVLPVTYTNMPIDPQAEVIFYESDGETIASYDWITANINGDGNVAGHIDANDGDARSAYFKVKGKDADGNDVYSGLVTVNQAAYTLSIVFETTSLDIEAGGEQNRIISFEYEGLGENPTFTVRTYDASGETQTTYDWLTTSITDVHKVNITVAANTGDARSAYFKVYGENGTINTESNLVTINQAAAGQTVQYTLITSVDDLTPGYHYLIASEASEGDLNIMDVQNSNNRGVKAATVDEYNTITFTPNAAYYDFVISGDTNNGWTIYDESTTKTGYLYAASSTKNYLRTQSSNDANGIWSITINNEGVATIVAQGSNTRNTMQYNSSNSLFACYSLASESAVYLYKKVGDTNPVYYSPTEIAVANPDPTSEPIIVVNNEILVLTGNLDKCNNPDNLIVEDGGQLVFSGTGVQATMKKSTAHASAKDVATDWYTIASPLAANVLTNAVGNLTNGTYDLYRYNEAAVMWENAKDTEHSGGFNELTVGRGYLYWNGSGSDITFAGELRNTDVAYTLKADGAGNYKGFNLIGNPFSQNITMSNITEVTLSGGYVLTQAGGWGASIDEIAPCQGFLVQVEAETDITITKPTSSSKSRANRDYIALTVANSEYEDVTYALFSDGMGLSKINHRNADIPMVYIPQDGQNYAIATMDDNTQAFELNFKAMTTGQYTLSYKAEGKYSYLHVIDRLTGEDIDMLLDGKYSFIGSPRDNEARFIVKLSYNANIDEIEVNDNFAYQNGSDIIVNGNGELQVFDVTGRMVMNTKINGIQTVNVPATGMYIFRMVGESVQTQKIVVR